ncbi:MAG: M48 family metalloprotease [Pseudomonadota bacterium]
MTALLLSLLLLGGCAGAQFKLPELTDAEINRAALTVAGDASQLPVFARPRDEERALVYGAADRLEEAVPALCQYAKTRRCYFDVAYVVEDTANAQADENNRIEMFSGLIKYLATEDEVAAVIGHEMGHVIAEHVEESQQNATIGAILGGLLMGGALAASSAGGTYNDPYYNQRLINRSMQVGAGIGVVTFSKEQEREADLLSAYLLARAGYDLDKAGRVWTVLTKMSGKTHSSMFDTHPTGPERLAAWEKAVSEVEASPDKLPKE